MLARFIARFVKNKPSESCFINQREHFPSKVNGLKRHVMSMIFADCSFLIARNVVFGDGGLISNESPLRISRSVCGGSI
jgi:hypothetical protein